MDPLNTQTLPSTVDSTQQPPLKTSHSTINKKISALWKSIADRWEMPKPIQQSFATLHTRGMEVQKRIGYALRQILPNLCLPNPVVQSKESPAGKDSVLYVLTRKVNNSQSKEPLVECGTFLITKQVQNDIPRTFWPLSYRQPKALRSKRCPYSHQKAEKTESILNWLQENVLSDLTSKIPKDSALQKQAMINLSLILFHQSMSADLVVDAHNKEGVMMKASEDPPFHRDASLSATRDGLEIKLTWIFTITAPVKDDSASMEVIGTRRVIRKIQIPWEELVADWDQSPPTNPRLTVQDTI